MREEAWTWVTQNLDALIGRLPAGRAGGLPWIAERFCDAGHRKAAEELFLPRLPKLEGGPRNLASALEAVDLCIARRGAQEANVRAYFTKQK